MASGFDMDAPSFYHDASVSIGMDPQWVHEAAHTYIKHQLELVNASWKKIADTLDDLKLGWAGGSASASEEFFNRLLIAQADMFGVKDDVGTSKAGILDLLRWAAVNSAASFGAAEDAVTDLCNKFANGLTATPSEEDKKKDPADDLNGPISIDYGKA